MKRFGRDEPHTVVERVRVYLPNRAKIVEVGATPDVRKILSEMKRDGETWVAGTVSQHAAIDAVLDAEEAYHRRFLPKVGGG